MLLFLYPWWLLALPLIALPWFFPLFQKPKHSSQPFSAFFLLPRESFQQQFHFSKEEWFLKATRSLILLFFILLLASPFWESDPPKQEVWVIDDTPSAQWNQLAANWNNFIPDQASYFLLSDLFPPSKNPALVSVELPSTIKLPEAHTGSPNLTQIADAVLQKLDNELKQKKRGSAQIHLHLVSDFQASQYGTYQTAIQEIQWSFHRPSTLHQANNLSLHHIQIQTQGVFKSTLSMDLVGNISKHEKVRIWVQQNKQDIGTELVEWEGKNQAVTIQLDSAAKINQPMEVLLESKNDEFQADNVRFFQKTFMEDLWVGILSSEGTTGIYRHGLHPLKSALNANGYYSFLLSNVKAIAEYKPQLLLFLGDHPLRYMEVLQSSVAKTLPKLFIPTRLEDWKKQALYSKEGQWQVDWTQISFAQEWGIKKITPLLYYSEQKDLWFLTTGLSAAWGNLYKNPQLPDQIKLWFLKLNQDYSNRYAGVFESGNLLPFSKSTAFSGLGHYKLQEQSVTKNGKSERLTKQINFSVNLPQKESDLQLMSDKEWKEMQDHFESYTPILPAQSLSSANALRTGLLWLLLACLCLELFRSAARLRKSNL